MGYHVVREHEWDERPKPEGREDDPARLAADLTTSAGLTQSRARLWRYPPGARGRRRARHRVAAPERRRRGGRRPDLGRPARAGRSRLLRRRLVASRPPPRP